MSEWTSVKEDMPPVSPYDEYIVYDCIGEMYMATWRGEEDGWMDMESCSISGVTYWMPLPEPPK